jgi:hypothetical protein
MSVMSAGLGSLRAGPVIWLLYTDTEGMPCAKQLVVQQSLMLEQEMYPDLVF